MSRVTSDYVASLGLAASSVFTRFEHDWEVNNRSFAEITSAVANGETRYLTIGDLAEMVKGRDLLYERASPWGFALIELLEQYDHVPPDWQKYLVDSWWPDGFRRASVKEADRRGIPYRADVPNAVTGVPWAAQALAKSHCYQQQTAREALRAIASITADHDMHAVAAILVAAWEQ